jgi:hypothetical protein
MALESTQSLTETSSRNLPGGKGHQVRRADTLTAICEQIVYKMWEPRRLTTLWTSTACYRVGMPLFCFAFYLLAERKAVGKYVGPIIAS